MSVRTLGLVALFLAVPRLAFAVQGGVEDRATSHAVAIARGAPGRDAVKCSGTLISANVVLTVRHCIGGVVPSSNPCDARLDAIASDAAEDLWMKASPWTDDTTSWKKAASVRVPATNAICGDDVALVVLRDAVDPSEAVPARPALDEASFVHAIEPRVMGLAGFGVTDPRAEDLGTRRSKFDIPLRCVPGRPGYACDADLAFMGDREFSSGAGPCRGDSGGGAVAVGDRGVVFGVLSRGELGSGDTTCTLGVFERTDPWAWLIGRTVLDAASSSIAAPSWATELFPSSPAKNQFCSDASPCREGLACATFDEKRSFVCAAKCESSATCSAGETCREGICTPADAGPSAEGSSCAMGTRSPRSVGVGIVAIQLALLLRRSRRRRLRCSDDADGRRDGR